LVIKNKSVKKAIKKSTKGNIKKSVKSIKSKGVKNSVVKSNARVMATKASVTAASKKALAKDKKQDIEINKLKAELAKVSKKKKNTKRISEYNLFVRKQIKSGLTFTQAAKEWGKYQKLISTPKRKQSAYNQFIGSQMKLGKTFQQSVALWKLAKAGKLGKKGTTRTVTQTVVRRIKSKPQVVVKRIHSKPKVITRTNTVTKNVGLTKTQVEQIFNSSTEEIAFNMVETYFKELAREGFKKQLTLDEVINAYLYSLARVKRQNIEMSEVASAVKEARLRK
jgi:hypothetical protein